MNGFAYQNKPQLKKFNENDKFDLHSELHIININN